MRTGLYDADNGMGARGPNDQLRAARLARRLTQDELAEELTQLRWSKDPDEAAITAHMVCRWERGKRRPQGVQERLLMDYFDAKEPGELGLRDWSAASAGRYDGRGAGHTRRREFIAATAGTLASLAGGALPDPLVTALDRLSHLADSALGVAVDGYEAVLAELAFTYSQEPAARLYGRLDALLGHVQAHLADAPPAAYRSRLLSLAGWTANLLAMACYDLGESGAAMLNATLALEYGRQAGDARLIARTRDRQALVAEDGHRLDEALLLARQALAEAPPQTGVTVGLRWTDAILSAKLGRDADARAGLRALEEEYASLPPSEIGEGSLSFSAERVVHAMGSVLGLLGELDAAEAHITIAIEHYANAGRPTRLATARFDLAHLLLAAGRPDEATAVASAALVTDRPVTPVWLRAGAFDSALLSQHPELAEARAFRERYLALEAGPPAG